MMALPPSPASSQVCRALCAPLTSTRAKSSPVNACRIAAADRRPSSVKGTSVVPVCRPLRLHAVSPCLITKTFMSASLLDVVGLGRARRLARRLALPYPVLDFRHVVAVAADVLPMLRELVADF